MILYEESSGRLAGRRSAWASVAGESLPLSAICVNWRALTISKSHFDSSGLGMGPFTRGLLGENKLDQVNKKSLAR